MTTIGDADLPEESDPEDADFEGSVDSSDAESGSSHALQRGGKMKKKKRVDQAALAQATSRAETLWAEMKAEESAAPLKTGGRGPVGTLSDPLWRHLQRRHPKPAKQRATDVVLAELKKHCGIVVDEEASDLAAAAKATAAQIKQRVRAEVAAARQAPVVKRTVQMPGFLKPLTAGISALSTGTAITASSGTVPTASPLVVSAPGAPLAKEFVEERPQKLRRSTVGQHDPVPSRDSTLVEKADLDWRAHKERLGVDGRDLARDRVHSGALERKAFLARTAARTEALSRADGRAAARHKVALAARQSM